MYKYCKNSVYLAFGKRTIDILIALGVFSLFFWLFLIIAALVRFGSKGPVVYSSKRVGINGRIYLMPKFRTMRTDTPEVDSDQLVDPETYITPIGKFLRKSSLDELPQLWSVLIGDMSLVGPRPALVTQEELTELRETSDVLTILPGITGWAQVNGRDKNGNHEKVQLDIFYVKNRSLRLDLKILWITFLKIFGDHNINH